MFLTQKPLLLKNYSDLLSSSKDYRILGFDFLSLSKK